jgi:hypothetical protein
MEKILIGKAEFWFGSKENIFAPDIITEQVGKFTYIYKVSNQTTLKVNG